MCRGRVKKRSGSGVKYVYAAWGRGVLHRQMTPRAGVDGMASVVQYCDAVL